MKLCDENMETVFEEVGYDPLTGVPRGVWLSYNDGTTESHDTQEEARKRSTVDLAFLPESAEEFDKFMDRMRNLESQASEIWYKSLRQDYPYLSTDVFEVCYSKVYSIHHLSGYDAMAKGMVDIVSFAEKVIAAF